MIGHARRGRLGGRGLSGRPGVAETRPRTAAAEAWQGERFARVQQRLVAATTAGRRGARRRSVVVLPSRSVDRWHEPPAETRSYEERLLSFLLDLRDPALEMTYVSLITGRAAHNRLLRVVSSAECATVGAEAFAARLAG